MKSTRATVLAELSQSMDEKKNEEWRSVALSRTLASFSLFLPYGEFYSIIISFNPLLSHWF